jgi:hypothetical protein
MGGVTSIGITLVPNFVEISIFEQNLEAVHTHTLGHRLTTYATYDRPHLQPQKK